MLSEKREEIFDKFLKKNGISLPEIEGYINKKKDEAYQALLKEQEAEKERIRSLKGKCFKRRSADSYNYIYYKVIEIDDSCEYMICACVPTFEIEYHNDFPQIAETPEIFEMKAKNFNEKEITTEEFLKAGEQFMHDFLYWRS